MSYSFEIDNKKNLMVVSYDETTTYDEKKRVLDEIVAILIENPTMGILLDIRSESNKMTEDQHQEYGVLLASRKEYFDKSRLAILRKDASVQLLMHSIAYALGFYHFVEFDDEYLAFQWVCGEVP